MNCSLLRASVGLIALLGALVSSGWGEDRPPMVRIPSGNFKPLFMEGEGESESRDQVAAPVPVGAFELDVYAVSNADYAAFVSARPDWRKSRVRRVFADSKYLNHWKSDLRAGDPRIAHSPVTHVSWFAARAYCEWVGKELPSVVEWEYAAAVSDDDATAQAAYKKLLLEWYGMPNPERLPKVGSTAVNRYGVYDLHGLVWEWTSDFNSALVMQDARGGGGKDAGQFCGGAAAGATDFKDYAGFMRYAFRNSLQGNYTVANLGFRCMRRAGEASVRKGNRS